MNNTPIIIATVGGLLLFALGVGLAGFRHTLWRTLTDASDDEQNPWGIGALVMGGLLAVTGLGTLLYFAFVAIVQSAV